MGNTNLPQAGAASTKNSRDTFSGEDQLADQQKSQGGQRDKAGVGPSPSRPKNAPPRIPGQLRDPQVVDDVEGADDKKRDRNESVEQAAERDPRNPTDNTAAVDPPALGGHANTGHSPPDAT